MPRLAWIGANLGNARGDIRTRLRCARLQPGDELLQRGALMRPTTIIGPDIVIPPALHHGDGVVVHVDNRVPVAHLFRQVKEVRLVYELANLRYVDRRE